MRPVSTSIASIWASRVLGVREDYSAWTQSAGVMKFALDLVEGAGLPDEAAKLRPIARAVVREWEACARAAGVDEATRANDLTTASTNAARDLGDKPDDLSQAISASARAVGMAVTVQD